MKAVLEFTLPEEKESYEITLDARKWREVWMRLKNDVSLKCSYLYEEVKKELNLPKNEAEHNAVVEVLHLMRSIEKEFNLSLDPRERR